MSQLLTPIDIERIANNAGLKVAAVCRKAGVSQSIFTRWKAGATLPTMYNYTRLVDAVEALVAESAPKSKPSTPSSRRRKAA